MFKPALLVIFTFLIASCDAIPFSGGKLQGEVKPIPDGWPEVTQEEVIEIQTNPTDPYSVKLWVVVMNNHPYIHAGANRATWVEHLEQNPELILGHDGSLYELSAVRVTDMEEFNELREIYKDKYGNYPRNSNLNEIYLYRLDAR